MLSQSSAIRDGTTTGLIPGQLSTSTITLYTSTHYWIESIQLTIKSINVPALVKAGEVDHVILDCDYDLENISTDGLVVKWFFNYDNVEYQWIYGHKPQADPMASYIDLGYKASNDPYTMYRAMKLNNPTINLTGDYRCAVFTYEEEQIADATMIVYSAEEKFNLQYREKKVDGETGMEVICFAEGLYPQPTMDISINDLVLNDTGLLDLTMREDGKYNIMMRAISRDDVLASEALVRCNLAIPQANYTRSHELTYYSGSSTTTPSVTDNLLRKTEMQAINNSEPDIDNGGDGSLTKFTNRLLITMGIIAFTAVQ